MTTEQGGTVMTEGQEMNLEQQKDKKAVEEKREEESTYPNRVLACLVIVYIVYIVLGGIIFHFIESDQEQQVVSSSSQKIKNFLGNNTCVSAEELEEFISDVIEAYDQGITLSNDTSSHDSTWDIVSSVFFCTTIVTTIGYGNISPGTSGGRTFAVFFALFGIPLFVIVSGQLGRKLTNSLDRLANWIVGKTNVKGQFKGALSALIVITIGFIVFCICAAGIFSVAEGWTYADSMYYTFITLTTIGFGDYYPSFAGGRVEDSVGVAFYRIYTSVWIIIGLIWMATVISTVGDAISALIASRASTTPLEDTKSSEETTTNM